MTKRSLIHLTELKRMAEVANLEGVTVELERDGTILRVTPCGKAHVVNSNLTREEAAEAALNEWLAGQAASGSGGSPPKAIRKGKAAIPARSSAMSEADQIRERLFIQSLKTKGKKPPRGRAAGT